MLYRAIDREGKSLTVWDHMLCGVASGVACGPVLCPMELVRSVLQIQTGGEGQVYKGAIDVVRKVGFFNIWRGTNNPFSLSYLSNTSCKKKKKG